MRSSREPDWGRKWIDIGKWTDIGKKTGAGRVVRDLCEKREYGRYEWSRKDLVLEGMKCVLIVLVLSAFFYRSLWAVIPLSGIGVWYWSRDSKRKAEQERHRLLLQFRDMIRSVAGAMRAGYSVENAFLASYEDMCMMHGRESMICMELKWIQRGLAMSLTMEELLMDLGKRSRTEQIREFAAVFAIARRNGGSMTEVIGSFAVQIQRQADTKEEILTQTAGRRMEQNIMNVMPFGILTYISISNKGYFDMLYHNVSGVVIMSVCLAAYLAACWLAEVILAKAVTVWE